MVCVVILLCFMELASGNFILNGWINSNNVCCTAGGVDGCGEPSQSRTTVEHGAGQSPSVPAAAVASVYPRRRRWRWRRSSHSTCKHLPGRRRLRRSAAGQRRPAAAVPTPAQLVRAPVGRRRRRRGCQRRRAEWPSTGCRSSAPHCRRSRLHTPGGTRRRHGGRRTAGSRQHRKLYRNCDTTRNYLLNQLTGTNAAFSLQQKKVALKQHLYLWHWSR